MPREPCCSRVVEANTTLFTRSIKAFGQELLIAGHVTATNSIRYVMREALTVSTWKTLFYSAHSPVKACRPSTSHSARHRKCNLARQLALSYPYITTSN